MAPHISEPAQTVTPGSAASRQEPAHPELADAARPKRTLSAFVVVGTAVLVCLTVVYMLIDQGRLFDLKIYYRAINYWASGHNLYDYAQADATNLRLGYTYPPLAAVLMIPMAGLPLSVVCVISVVAIIAAAGWCTWICVRERFVIPRHRLALVICVTTAGAFLLEPVRATLFFGQVNLYLMALVLIDILILDRRGSRWTGIGIGLAAAIKLTPGIFLLYFLLGRRWRPVMCAAITGAGTSMLAALVMPVETWRYYTSLLFDPERVGFLYAKFNQSLQGLLARIAVPGQMPTYIVLLVLLAVGILVSLRIRRALVAGDALAGLTLTGLLGVLISPASWVHHTVWIIPAVVIMVAGIVNRTRRNLPVLLALLTATVLLMAVDLRELLFLPDVYFSSATMFQRVAASAPMFWVLVTALALPIWSAPPARGCPAQEPTPHRPATTFSTSAPEASRSS